jgi:pyruvate,water dikinase
VVGALEAVEGAWDTNTTKSLSPPFVGTREAIEVLNDDQEITISCAEGNEGYVYEGILDFEEAKVSLKDIPKTRTQILHRIMRTLIHGYPGWEAARCKALTVSTRCFVLHDHESKPGTHLR